MRVPTRYIGETMIGLGATHIALGIALYHRQFRAMAREGVVGTVEGRPDRELAFWFTIFGPVLIAHGQFARWSLRRTGALPEGWAWNLLATFTAGTVLMPRSGFWFGIPHVLLSIAAARTSDAKRG